MSPLIKQSVSRAILSLACLAALACGGKSSGSGEQGDALTPGAEAAVSVPGADATGGAQETAAPVECPKDPNTPEPCATDGKTCTVGGACCLCEKISACGPSLMWGCVKPSGTPECGTSVPAPMSACAPDRLKCNYCTDGKPAVRECGGGKWYEQNIRICR